MYRALSRSQDVVGAVIRIPTYVWPGMNLVRDSIGVALAQGVEQPNIYEIADIADEHEKLVRRSVAWLVMSCVSYDRLDEIQIEGRRALANIDVDDKEDLDPIGWRDKVAEYDDTDCVRSVDIERIFERLYTLETGISDRNLEVLEHRYGLAGETPKTLGEIGSILNLTRERIRQIESKALTHFRQASVKALLCLDDSTAEQTDVGWSSLRGSLSLSELEAIKLEVYDDIDFSYANSNQRRVNPRRQVNITYPPQDRPPYEWDD